MTYSATITSKRQLTIPIEAYKKLNLNKGEKVIVSVESNAIKIESEMSLIDRLAGSVVIPKNLRKTPIEEAIKQGKMNYFTEKYKNYDQK